MDKGTRKQLEGIGKPYHLNKAALIRLAVYQLIAATKANGGQLPAAMRDYHEAPAVAAGEGDGR